MISKKHCVIICHYLYFLIEVKYYTVLNISKSASPAEIIKVYRKLSLHYHPDRPNGDEEKFKQINEAYTVLSNPSKRAQYDELCEKEDAWKKFEAPNCDFTHLSKNEQNDIAQNYRQRLYGWLNYCSLFREELSKHTKLNQRTLLSSLKYRSTNFNIVEPNLLKRLKKYYSNTTRPYKTYQFKGLDQIKELSQVLFGIMNLSLGIIYGQVVITCGLAICLLPILVPLAHLFNQKREKETFLDLSLNLSSEFAKMLFLAVTLFFTYSCLGLAQLITTPLTWIVIFPIRTLITLTHGYETAEMSPHIQRILKEAEEALEDEDKVVLRLTTISLHAKYSHAIKYKKRDSKCFIEDEELFFEEVEKQFVLSTLNPQSSKPINQIQRKAIQEYLGFFRSYTRENGEHFNASQSRRREQFENMR